VEVERKHFSISLAGRWRVRTHSRKLAQWFRLPLELDFTSVCRPPFPSGATR
jgi:hypothetical protein